MSRNADELGESLSRRESQIMDVLYQSGEASVADVLAALPDPPGYSAVRALLRILEDKGHVRHFEDGKRYVYRPVHAKQNVAGGALRRVVQTFFGGSVEGAVATLLSGDDARRLSDEELARLSELIEAARRNSSAAAAADNADDENAQGGRP